MQRRLLRGFGLYSHIKGLGLLVGFSVIPAATLCQIPIHLRFWWIEWAFGGGKPLEVLGSCKPSSTLVCLQLQLNISSANQKWLPGKFR